MRCHMTIQLLHVYKCAACHAPHAMHHLPYTIQYTTTRHTLALSPSLTPTLTLGTALAGDSKRLRPPLAASPRHAGVVRCRSLHPRDLDPPL